MSAKPIVLTGLLAASLLGGAASGQSQSISTARDVASLPGAKSLYSTPLLQRRGATPLTQAAGGGGCDVLLNQAPDGLNAYFSDESLDFNGGSQSIAESLTLATDHEICSLQIWGLFFPGSTVPPGGFELLIHEDAGGIPGPVVYSESNVTATIVETGNVLFAANEIEVLIEPAVPVLLSGGTTYWFEIYYTSGFGTTDFAWETATSDPAGGLGFSAAFEAPGMGWGDAGVAEELALVVRGTEVIDPCLQDDFLEDNDDCGQEIVLGDGLYLGLFASKTDWDYFALTVAPGDTLDISVTHDQSVGDIDAFLYAADMCADFASGDVGCAGSLDCAFTLDDVETLSFTNMSGVCETYILKINVWPPTTTGECNNYDLAISGTVGGPIGASYCAQNANSTGEIARITALGSDVAADDQLTLVANRLPANQIGYFIVSLTSGAVDLPGVGLSDGILCLGSGTGRYTGQNGNPGMVLDSGDAGTFCLSGIDTTMIPLSSGMDYPAVAGLSTYFTAWFRDPSGVIGNNFTDAVQIDWQ